MYHFWVLGHLLSVFVAAVNEYYCGGERRLGPAGESGVHDSKPLSLAGNSPEQSVELAIAPMPSGE